jgi:hypothetical protein
VDRWCDRHGIERGEVVLIEQVWSLGRAWYARHADPDWRKWTGAEAAAIFEGVGLRGTFWRFARSDQPLWLRTSWTARKPHWWPTQTLARPPI